MPRLVRHLSILALALFASTLISGCSQSGKTSIRFSRFERLLFDTPESQLQRALTDHRSEFDSELLNIYPENAQFMAQLSGFVSDPIMRQIYDITDSCFHDLSAFEKELSSAMDKAQAICPSINYSRFYTMVTGTFDYSNRVFCNDHDLVISLDQYALPHMGRFSHFGCPSYLVHQSLKQYMLVDCMTAIARQHIVLPENEMTLLDYMIAEGKAIYFASQTLPDAADSILLRYTQDQCAWMEANEEHVWSYLLQNKLLFDNDHMRFHNFIDDAPQTNAFRDSAPRTTDYIGWHIVSRYMKKSGCSVQQLFEKNNSQEILNESGYRPK